MKYKILRHGDSYAVKVRHWMCWRWELDMNGFIKTFESDYTAMEYIFKKYKPLKQDRWIHILEADL